MSNTVAEDLFAQADRLMKQRSPEELPALTDLVVEETDPKPRPHDLGRRAGVWARRLPGLRGARRDLPAAAPVVPPAASVPLDAIPVVTERVSPLPARRWWRLQLCRRATFGAGRCCPCGACCVPSCRRPLPIRRPHCRDPKMREHSTRAW